MPENHTMNTRVTLGFETLLKEQLDLIAGKRVGLVASAASIDAELVMSAERLASHPDINLVALFGPEHGLRGGAQAGDQVSTVTDRATGLPIFSLYGATKKPTPEMLANLDVLLFDLQDGGVRFYTYLSTLAYVMQAAAEAGLPLLVLDRPNPLTGLRVEGSILAPAYRSFVGVYPIPIRHGMTAGEIARLFNEAFGIGCDLTVVPMRGWRRSMWFDDTGLPFVPPSPNLPALSALTLYPGTCLIEGTTLSEGRGTTKPFEYIGAPWLDGETLARALNGRGLAGVRFRPVYFTPTFSKHVGEPCSGVQIYATDRDRCQPLEVTLHLMAQVMEMHPDQFGWCEPWSPGSPLPIDLLSGGDTLRQHLDARRPVADLIASWEAPLDTFRDVRAHYLIYED
jgi:uncharacterized protein YbbC (DUF1343 family)